MAIGTSSTIGAEAPTILIGDGSYALLGHAMSALLSEGCQIFLAERGDVVLALACALRPAVIAIDIWFPDADGRDVLRDIKRDRRIRDIPVLLLSQRDYETDRLIAEELGAASYLPKAQLRLFTETVLSLVPTPRT
ncbi:MAG TPA: response regulator [Polyangiaceae bacterium]|nr:response regulator [Polyangiaceae bacterium]